MISASRISLSTALVACLAPASVLAQDSTMLVLDASGSMWGQIDERAKITIAQEVVAGLVADLPRETSLGLTAYGHRVKGDCQDIETLVEAAPGAGPSVADIAARLSPKGKTPMTAAVEMAARSMRFEENKATVVLISDGVETCAPDPCAAAAALEAAGVDFTAHVIGFDVTEAEALAQLQCIADETGGLFLTASNAPALSEALNTVVQEAAAPAFEMTAPDQADVDTVVEITWSGGPVDGHFLTVGPWEGAPWKNDTRLTEDGTARLLMPPRQGTFDIILRDAAQTPLVTEQIRVNRVDASVENSASVPIGTPLEVAWTGPGKDTDFIGLRVEDAIEFIEKVPLAGMGSTVEIALDVPIGSYDIVYAFAQDDTVIAKAPLEVTLPPASLDAPATAGIGELLSIGYEGPEGPNDFIAVTTPGNTDRAPAYAWTRNGNPLELRMPAEPGLYELQYRARAGTFGTVLHAQPIEVVAASVTLDAPERAGIGSMVDIAWTGPGNGNDRVSIGAVGAGGSRNYMRTSKGNPVTLRMPEEPGTYELSYLVLSGSDQEVAATRLIEVFDVSATLTAPETAGIGSMVKVTWDGPDNYIDDVSIGAPGAGGSRDYVRTSKGNPVSLRMPAQPGTYEIVYRLGGSGKVIASHEIEITPVTATLSAPATAAAGEKIAVAWEGPDNYRDSIALRKEGSSGRAVTSDRTSKGNPVTLRMPDTPGRYDLHYLIAGGTFGTSIGSISIEVTE